MVWFVGIVVPEQYCFLPVHFLTLLVLIAQHPGQAGVLGRLSLCLWKLEPLGNFSSS
jgi:hypothetical protein